MLHQTRLMKRQGQERDGLYMHRGRSSLLNVQLRLARDMSSFAALSLFARLQLHVVTAPKTCQGQRHGECVLIDAR
jgi:hypothetical protein